MQLDVCQDISQLICYLTRVPSYLFGIEFTSHCYEVLYMYALDSFYTVYVLQRWSFCVWHFAWVKLVVSSVFVWCRALLWAGRMSHAADPHCDCTHCHHTLPPFIHTHTHTCTEYTNALWKHSQHTRLKHTFSPVIWWMQTSLSLCRRAAITHTATHSVPLPNECSCRVRLHMLLSGTL